MIHSDPRIVVKDRLDRAEELRLSAVVLKEAGGHAGAQLLLNDAGRQLMLATAAWKHLKPGPRTSLIDQAHWLHEFKAMPYVSGKLYEALLVLDEPAKQMRGPRPNETNPVMLQLTLAETENLERAYDKLKAIVLDFMPKAYQPQPEPEPADEAPGPA